MQKIEAMLEEYARLGFDTLPLKPGSKKPLSYNWQRFSPEQMWRGAPRDVNIGIRTGGASHLAVIDCDEQTQPGTFGNIQRWLDGLGIKPGMYPVVQTASRIGRHVYAKLDGFLPGNYRIIPESFGAGEFRYGQGAYVVGIPSVVDCQTYVLLMGNFNYLPTFSPADIYQILAKQPEIQHSTPSDIPNKKIPRRTLALLLGKGIEKYPTWSNADQAILTGLVNAGFDFNGVLQIFLEYPGTGRYQKLQKEESPERAMDYLQRSIDNAYMFAKSNESKARQDAKAALDYANARPWPGRTGVIDRLVFIANCQIAYKAGKLVYHASCRDLAEWAGVQSNRTAIAATYRLIAWGLLTLETKAIGSSANIYRLLACGQTYTLPHSSGRRECVSLSTHDAFRYSGLGKSAAEVFQALQREPLTVEELIERTGRHSKTISRALNRMSSLLDTETGELLPMVEPDGNQWHALAVDLDHIAQVLGTAGAGERQKAKHKQERCAHQRALELGRNLKTSINENKSLTHEINDFVCQRKAEYTNSYNKFHIDSGKCVSLRNQTRWN